MSLSFSRRSRIDGLVVRRGRLLLEIGQRAFVTGIGRGKLLLGQLYSAQKALQFRLDCGQVLLDAREVGVITCKGSDLALDLLGIRQQPVVLRLQLGQRLGRLGLETRQEVHELGSEGLDFIGDCLRFLSLRTSRYARDTLERDGCVPPGAVLPRFPRPAGCRERLGPALEGDALLSEQLDRHRDTPLELRFLDPQRSRALWLW